MKTIIRVSIPEGSVIHPELVRELLGERDSLIEEVEELEAELEHSEQQVEQQCRISGDLQERCDKLEEYIVRIRGSLPGPADMKRKAMIALSDILPEILAFAKSVKRGTGSAANYEYQFRHAEHRAKLVKENLRAARKMMAGMIVTVGSIADRTENDINPEDIHHLRDELDQLSGYQEVIEHIEIDSYLDGVMPEPDVMADADLARRMKK